jgi:hypothetical protein
LLREEPYSLFAWKSLFNAAMDGWIDPDENPSVDRTERGRAEKVPANVADGPHTLA